jgi:hypothetical protein
MKKHIVFILAVAIFLNSCKKSATTPVGQQIIFDKSIDSFILRLEPIGDFTNSTFNEYITGNSVGFASIFKKEAFKKNVAKDNYTVIDFIYYLNPFNSVSSNGKIHFYNPALFNQNYNSLLNLGWPAYLEGPKFIALLRSKRFDNITGAYYGLSEEEFDKIITPEDIKGIITHSQKYGSDKRTDFAADYFGSKTDGIQLLGLIDSKGYESIIKILPGVNIFNLTMKVKRGYSTR